MAVRLIDHTRYLLMHAGATRINAGSLHLNESYFPGMIVKLFLRGIEDTKAIEEDDSLGESNQSFRSGQRLRSSSLTITL